MLKFIVFTVSLSLILLIFLRIPKENVGLSSYMIKTEIFNSPRSTERLLNFSTLVGVLIYFSIALKLNLTN